MPEYKTISQFQPDNLIAGDFPIVTEGIILAVGQNLKRGAVLGRIQANGQYVLSVASTTDGSENPIAILAEDVDAVSSEVESVGYISGQFNTHALIFGAGLSADAVKHNLRMLNIYLTASA